MDLIEVVFSRRMDHFDDAIDVLKHFAHALLVLTGHVVEYAQLNWQYYHLMHFSSFSLVESPSRDLQITANK